MAYTTINKSTDYFNTKLYTGNGADGNAVTNVGHSPDFVWIKQRNSMSHRLYDKIRGVNSALISNESNAEDQYSAYGQFESFDSDGFTVGAGTSNGHGTNENGQSIVSWNWKANGTGSANTDGSINSTVSVNTTAGFSIVKFVATGSNATVGHGLGVAPAMIILKNLDSARSWAVGHTGMTNWNYHMYFDGSNVENSDSTMFQGTAPTSTVFSVGTASETNESGDNFIAYCFAPKEGFSKFSNYVGNGSSSRPPFIYTGFKPKLVIVKCTNEADSWFIHDNKRDGYNDDNEYLFVNSSAAEGSNINRIRLLSNGFSVPTTDKSHNKSGNGYIYMAFGQSLVGTNNIPCTAR